jgi:hypothetical protein
MKHEGNQNLLMTRQIRVLRLVFNAVIMNHKTRQSYPKSK